MFSYTCASCGYSMTASVRISDTGDWRCQNCMVNNNITGVIIQQPENDGKETFSETQQQIIKTCDDLKEFLLEKNRSYGDSALNPVRIFSNADPVEQIKVRLDDKISRLKGGGEYLGDDTIKDLAGYLILFIIATTSPER